MGLQEYLEYMDYVKDSYTSGKDDVEKVRHTIQNLSADVFQRVSRIFFYICNCVCDLIKECQSDIRELWIVLFGSTVTCLLMLSYSLVDDV